MAAVITQTGGRLNLHDSVSGTSSYPLGGYVYDASTMLASVQHSCVQPTALSTSLSVSYMLQRDQPSAGKITIRIFQYVQVPTQGVMQAEVPVGTNVLGNNFDVQLFGPPVST